jgi:DNA invertase Pin-like site-specific DNA recombinase
MSARSAILTSMKIGYARCSTARQDVAGQVAWLGKLGVDDAQVYTDHGYTGRNRKRPALARALEVCRSGDQLVVTKLDRLGRSARDLHQIVDGLVERNVALNIDGKVYDPTDPMGKMFIGFLAIMAEFESDLNRQRTKAGVEVAKAKGKMRGKQHKLSPLRRNLLLRDHETGRFTVDDLCAGYNLKKTALYENLKLARNERASATSESTEDELSA